MNRLFLLTITVLMTFCITANAQTEKSSLKFDIQGTPEKKENVNDGTTSQIVEPTATTASSTINKSEVFFSYAKAVGNDVEIVCGVNPRINGTRMEALSVKYEVGGKLTSKQSRVTGYGGKPLPRDGNVLNRGNRLNRGETFYVTATIKNAAHSRFFDTVFIRVWTSYGEGDVILRNVTW